MGEGVREIGETVRHGACTRALAALPVGLVQGRSGESPPFPLPPPGNRERPVAALGFRSDAEERSASF